MEVSGERHGRSSRAFFLSCWWRAASLKVAELSPRLQLVGMGVVVPMTMPVCPDFFGLRRSGTTMGGFAVRDFELDGGVGDLESVAQRALDIRQNITALGHRHFGDGDVAGERMGLRA